MLNFDILEEGLGRVSPPHCIYDFSIQVFLMLYSITRIFFIRNRFIRNLEVGILK